MKTFYGKQPPRTDPALLKGTLIVIEGPDSVGRSTQIQLISHWLEEKGHAVVQTGLARSRLAGCSLRSAKKNNSISHRTLSLFYATDFYDQMENEVFPALRSGLVVLADRYFYTLIARDLVRGADPDWVENLYSMAVVPEAVYYLDAPPRTLVERTLASYGHLNYWETGMDLGASQDWFDSFVGYQKKLKTQFLRLGDRYGFQQVNANRSINAVFADLRVRIAGTLSAQTPASLQAARLDARRP